jgi:hypothetical protein
MLPECHITTAEHPIPIVVVARHARGHVLFTDICDAIVTDEPMPQTCATWQRERRKLALYISILDPILMLLDTTIPTA